MKIAILCDTHFGARSDSPIFMHHFFTFVDTVFFPYLKKHGITELIHLGDLMDRRKFVNFAVLHETRKRFIEPLLDNGIHTTLLLGNHDTYFKNTSDINSVTELFGVHAKSDLFDIIESPCTKTIGGTEFLLLPWINKNNQEESEECIRTTSAQIALGHLELCGYEVLRGITSDHGLDANILSKFESVYSGHFHCKHSKGNVHYLGTPYQITFGDLNEPKGFHIFDTETRNMEFVPNPNKIFEEIFYNDNDNDYRPTPNFDQYKKCFVRVRVVKKLYPAMFDAFMEGLNAVETYGVTVIEDKTLGCDVSEEVDISKDTLTLINHEIDQLTLENPNKLKLILQNLYTESLFM